MCPCLCAEFDTTRMEMGAVADLFDKNGEGLIDWQEFIAALRPDWQDRKPANDSEKIHDEVKRLVMLCTCRQKFRVFQVGEGKYRFGDSQKLRLVRILRSTVMVRVGGGWCALDEFLVKNDPCRGKRQILRNRIYLLTDFTNEYLFTTINGNGHLIQTTKDLRVNEFPTAIKNLIKISYCLRTIVIPWLISNAFTLCQCYWQNVILL